MVYYTVEHLLQQCTKTKCRISSRVEMPAALLRNATNLTEIILNNDIYTRDRQYNAEQDPKAVQCDGGLVEWGGVM